MITACDRTDRLQPLLEHEIHSPDGEMRAEIHRNEYGVPLIKANDLKSAAFGQGYAQAKDNICLISDMVLKVRSERAKYYGPGPDNFNVITDFSIKALGIYEEAKEGFDRLSAESQAIYSGFAAGYNQFLGENGLENITDPRCSGRPWVQKIEPHDVYAYLKTIALMTSSNWIAESGLMFIAAPPDTDPMPHPVSHMQDDDRTLQAGIDLADKIPLVPPAREGLGSNAWAIGSELSESGRGALLANPHFPYFGTHRFWQSHVVIPGVMNIKGAALIGIPLPQIGFTDHVAWTHTVSTSTQFTFYSLDLKEDDPLVYQKDGEEMDIEKQTFRIEVNTGQGEPSVMEKSFFFSEYGPMIAADRISRSFPAWGGEYNGRPAAFTFRESVSGQVQYAMDLWLGMARSANVEQFQSTFRECGNTFFVNTIYADDSGNALYIDGSSVPHLSEEARATVGNFPSVAGAPVLDGSNSKFDWLPGECGTGSVPFDSAPILLRNDFVQNSNGSHWATNPEELVTGYSPLYGPTESPLSSRTRIGLHMVMNPDDTGRADRKPAGENGKFGARDLIEVIYNNRAFHAELSGVLPELVNRCEVIGNQPVNYNDRQRTVDTGCTAIAEWDGLLNTDSRGAHTFRLFMGEFNRELPDFYTESFDPERPVETPAYPKGANENISEDPMLQSLAKALDQLDEVNFSYDAPLGEVQRVHLSAGSPPGGELEQAGPPIPWHGGAGGLEGAFNLSDVRVFGPNATETGTRYPVFAPENPAPHTAGMSSGEREGWFISGGTSWHFGLEFTDQGPEAYGLMSYSQTSNPELPWFRNQHDMYSKKEYRKLSIDYDEILTESGLQSITITGRD